MPLGPEPFRASCVSGSRTSPSSRQVQPGPPRTGLASWQGRQVAQASGRSRAWRWAATQPWAPGLFRTAQYDVSAGPQAAGEGAARDSPLLGSQGMTPLSAVWDRRWTTVALIGLPPSWQTLPRPPSCCSRGAPTRAGPPGGLGTHGRLCGGPTPNTRTSEICLQAPRKHCYLLRLRRLRLQRHPNQRQTADVAIS